MTYKRENVCFCAKCSVFNGRSLAALGLWLLSSWSGSAFGAEADEEKPPFLFQMLQKIGPQSETLAGASGSGAKVVTLQGCPDVIVDGGVADLRSPPGAEASNLRYEIALGRTARECTAAGDDFNVKLGVDGSVLLGPAGQPGSYSANLRIALRRKKDEQLFSSKTLKVGASVPPGGSRGEFSLVVEDLSAPIVSANANDDYEIIIGFAPEAGTATSPGKKRRKKE
jgi:hypothetical protein